MGTRTATVEKQRDRPSGDSFEFTFDPVLVGEDHAAREAIMTVVVLRSRSRTPAIDHVLGDVI